MDIAGDNYRWGTGEGTWQVGWERARCLVGLDTRNTTGRDVGVGAVAWHYCGACLPPSISLTLNRRGQTAHGAG